ncbi:MAG: ABC transporter ATP-binding protein [Alicyclobacillaceae bacterium]|nr:ABC transporter ATP-binding protein [Alicyclobacillaceae bacterium]
MYAIETFSLTKDYGTGRGCRNITLTVGEGVIFGLLGPNGAGKSTFVKMLVGLLRPTSGKAQILGLPLGHLEARRRIGYLPELFRYPDWLTAEEVLRFHAKLAKLPPDRIERRTREVLAEVGLAGRERDRVRHFSKGMQQRLGLACALLTDPDVLFLDEPSSALDPGGRHEVRQLLSRLKQCGKTIFLNTHLLEDVERICDEVALLIDGVIRQTGPVEAIVHPEPVWRVRIGGWTPEMLEPLRIRAGILIEIEESDNWGSATLRVHAKNQERLAWVNALLVEHGLSLYEVQPVKTRLEEWFLAATEGRERAQ